MDRDNKSWNLEKFNAYRKLKQREFLNLTKLELNILINICTKHELFEEATLYYIRFITFK